MGHAYVKNHYGPVLRYHGLLLEYLEATEAHRREEIERGGRDG